MPGPPVRLGLGKFQYLTQALEWDQPLVQVEFKSAHHGNVDTFVDVIHHVPLRVAVVGDGKLAEPRYAWNSVGRFLEPDCVGETGNPCFVTCLGFRRGELDSGG